VNESLFAGECVSAVMVESRAERDTRRRKETRNLTAEWHEQMNLPGSYALESATERASIGAEDWMGR
jgi:hypothetical protein